MPSVTRPSRAQTLARRAVPMPMIAVVTVIACNDESRAAGRLLCGACWIVSRAGVEVAEDEAAALASCGDCAPGTSCNRLYRPPICARIPGRDGDLCGTFMLDTEYLCDLGFECRDGGCRSLPGLGAPCAFGALENWHLAPLTRVALCANVGRHSHLARF